MKRVVLFLLLLAIGITALRFAIGDDSVVTAKAPPPEGEQEPQDRLPGMPLPNDKLNAKWQARGAFHLPRLRSVPQPDGSVRHETVFSIDSKDSQPVGEGVQQLDDVTVTVFDRGAPAAKITSKRAFVELGHDEAGKVSVREDKEIDLRDAVLESLPDSRLPGLRLELGAAKVHVHDDFVELQTHTENDPVLLRLDGARPGTLRGNGLQARLPRDRSGRLQRADIDVLHEPVLESGDLVMRAHGRMHLTEDLTSGCGQVAVEDTVALETTTLGGLRLRGVPGLPAAGPGAVGTAGPTTARGQHLLGWFVRSGGEGAGLVWQRVELRGSPATVDSPGLRLETPQLSLLPGMSGEPVVVVASGGPSRLEFTPDEAGRARGESPIVAASPRRIHLLRPGDEMAAAYRSFGFPMWSLGQLRDQQVAVFEGAATVDGGPQSVRTGKGLHVFRPNPNAEATFVHGFGTVHVEQRAAKGKPAMIADGDDGFRLVARADGEELDLGPARPADGADGPWRQHHYTLRDGATEVTGTGACRTEHRGDTVHLVLVAPHDEIRAKIADQPGEVHAVRSLDAKLVRSALADLHVCGVPAVATFVRAGEQLTARAPRIEQIGPASLLLLPPDEDAGRWRDLPAEQRWPQLRRTRAATPGRPGEDFTTTAPYVEIHHLGEDRVLVDAQARGDEPARANGSLQRRVGGEPTRLSAAAARLRFLPCALPPLVRAGLAGGRRGPLVDTAFAGLSTPWVIGDEVRELVVDDAEHGHLEGTGHLLLLSQGGESGLFVGDPGTGAPTRVVQTHEGRSVVATGARVRLVHDTALRLQVLRTFPGQSAFVLPTVELHQAHGTGPTANLRATCQGEIEVLPTEVVFTGPVVADGLRPDGEPDPEGLHVDARHLHFDRHPRTNEVKKITGTDVFLSLATLRARAERMEFDLSKPGNQLVFRGTTNAAVVELGDGRRFEAERIKVDQETLSIDSTRGVFEQVPTTQEPKR